jgi:hypothetical protein
VAYSNLLSDWHSEVQRICRALSVQLEPADEVDDFLTADLRHHYAEYRTVTGPNNARIGAVCEAFLDAADGGAVDYEFMDHAFANYQAMDPAARFRPDNFLIRPRESS